MAIAGILVRLAKMPDGLLLLEVYAAESVTLEGAAGGVVAKCGGGWSIPIVSSSVSIAAGLERVLTQGSRACAPRSLPLRTSSITGLSSVGPARAVCSSVFYQLGFADGGNGEEEIG